MHLHAVRHAIWCVPGILLQRSNLEATLSCFLGSWDIGCVYGCGFGYMQNGMQVDSILGTQDYKLPTYTGRIIGRVVVSQRLRSSCSNSIACNLHELCFRDSKT